MDGQERYLENFVRSASPARLRLLLIERGIEVAESLAATAESKEVVRDGTPAANGANERFRIEQMIRMRDILGELLDGVIDKEREVARQVADLYVFLLQFMGEAERDDRHEQWQKMASILRIEQETWAEVCSRLVRSTAADGPATPLSHLGGPNAGAAPANGSLNLQG